ncbi:MAG: hypothetical protein GVY15_06545 [Bacteroidetes bacterium]|jgi:hypothetical protein|nr:hypothetical protein [Bacteroidota bacterium]
MKSLLSIIAGLIAFALTAGCASDAETDHLFDRFALQDTLHLVEVVEIGDEEGTDLAMPVAPQLGSDGNIYVADAGYRDIRVFSPDGELLHTIGGFGEGPGEFRSADILALGAQDSLFVYDRTLRRLSAFAPLPDPTFEYSAEVKSSALRSPTELFAARSGALFAAYTRGVNQEGMEEGVWIAEINHNGEIISDSLAHLRNMEVIRASSGEGHMQAVGKPFARYPVLRPGPAGYPCYGWTGHLQIQCLREDGSAKTLIESPVPSRSVTAEDRQEALRRVEDAPNAATMIQEEGWHDAHRTYELFTIESPERIWIQGLFHPDAAGDAFGSLWHVIDTSEEAIYPVHLANPDDLIFAVQDARAFAYRIIPETDEARIVIYEIET